VYDRGVIGTLKMIVSKEGTMGLYRGLSVSLVKAAPASAITMWTYERTLDVMKKLQEEDN
jgi:solute carrier family 25 thiamine pyrophosphate transporter 19